MHGNFWQPYWKGSLSSRIPQEPSMRSTACAGIRNSTPRLWGFVRFWNEMGVSKNELIAINDFSKVWEQEWESCMLCQEAHFACDGGQMNLVTLWLNLGILAFDWPCSIPWSQTCRAFSVHSMVLLRHLNWMVAIWSSEQLSFCHEGKTWRDHYSKQILDTQWWTSPWSKKWASC